MLDHFSVYESRAIYIEIELRAPFFRDTDLDGCIDALNYIPAGSTIKRTDCIEGDFEVSSRVYRELLL